MSGDAVIGPGASPDDTGSEESRRSVEMQQLRIERLIVAIRAGALVVAALIVVVVRSDERAAVVFRNGLLPLALTVVVTSLLVRRADHNSVRIAGLLGMVGDTAAISLTMFSLLDDPADPVPILSVVLAVEAAARWRLVGGVVGGLLGATLGGAWVVAAHRNVGLDVPPEYVVTQSALTLLLAVLFGGLVGRLLQSQLATQTVLDLAPDLIATIDHGSTILTVNPAATRLLGRSSEDLVGRDYRELIVPAPGVDEPEGDLVDLLSRFGGRGTARRRFRHADGHDVWLEMSAQEQSPDSFIHVFARDVTERHRAEQALEASEQRLRVLFDRNLDAVVALDLDGRLTDANTAFLLLAGRDHEDEPGLTLADCVDTTDRSTLDELLAEACRGRPVDGELIVVNLDGSSRHVEIDLLPILLGDHVTGLYGLLRDVSETRRREERLAYEATHDPLTGLANRLALQSALDAAVAAAHPTALLFVDLDDFKSINDVHGHSAGDRVLITTGERLASAVREDDFVARLAGDEFCAVLFDADAESADVIARRIEDHLGRPIDLGGRTVRLSASVGIAVWEEGESTGDLFDRADERMYEAKELRSVDPDGAVARPERRRLRRRPPRPEPTG